LNDFPQFRDGLFRALQLGIDDGKDFLPALDELVSGSPCFRLALPLALRLPAHLSGFSLDLRCRAFLGLNCGGGFSFAAAFLFVACHSLPLMKNPPLGRVGLVFAVWAGGTTLLGLLRQSRSCSSCGPAWEGHPGVTNVSGCVWLRLRGEGARHSKNLVPSD
jgi:hypothetical protein